LFFCASAAFLNINLGGTMRVTRSTRLSERAKHCSYRAKPMAGTDARFKWLVLGYRTTTTSTVMKV
jgi:hypothetical protein